jgi:error-prone DNA polymerase
MIQSLNDPMYVELHARTAFSFLEGASLPEDMVGYAAQLKLPAIAVLDRDGLYGAPRFHMSADKAGLKAHIGAEVSCSPFSHSILCDLGRTAKENSFSPQSHGGTEKKRSRNKNKQLASLQEREIDNRKSRIENCSCLHGEFRLPLLVENRAGYQNLCRLITKMKLRAAKEEGSVYENELEEHASGLVCLTGGDDGPLAAALAQGGPQEAFRSVLRLVEIFGRKNVYVELQRHFHREEETRNRVAMEIAHALDLPILATNGVSYATAQERELCDVFTALRYHETLATAGCVLARNSERHLKSAAEMRELFVDVPDAISNTIELSARLEFTLNDLGYEFPRYPVPEGETMMSFLRERALEGFQQRYGRADRELKNRARRQVDRELALIEKLKLPGYFLIVWDIVRYCREQNILAQGRGSAANSAVCYSLGITAVDPVGMELLFERFLSEERGEWPDIDIDLPSGDQRESAIQYVYKRFGDRGAAMTANVITYRNRMAAREMGKAMGFDADSLDRISAAVATWEYKDHHDALDRRFHDAGLDLSHPRLRKYFELCTAVLDLPRHLGQHSGGMVICQGQLDSVVPLEPASMPGRVVVQWDKEDCADMHIIKVDLLGLGMLAVLEDSIQMIRDDYKEEVDIAHLPADDPTVYATLQKADTVGMFQIESRAQMSCLPRLRPKRFYDIVVQVAIIRPGPIVGQMVNPFIKRRQGREAVTYPHPSLEPVLARTLGVPLFQEQLLRMAMVVANFTGGEAEELRRAMGFKRSETRMKEIETRLRSGMRQNGISPEAEEQIVLSITSFALYGFPESHAASFALIAYASAYLKCHYLAAFTAALLNNQPMGFYHPSTIVKDAQRHGLRVLPIDITKSDWNCSLERSDIRELSAVSSQLSENPQIGDSQQEPRNFAVRLGLRYARGLREEAALALLRQRQRAPFESIHDLVRRVPELRKDELTTLGAIGALNSIGFLQDRSPRRNRGTEKNKKVKNHFFADEVVLSNQAEFADTNSLSQDTFQLITNDPPAESDSVSPCLRSEKKLHRRDALWQIERAVRYPGPLIEQLPEPDSPSPLQIMTHEERLVADFRGTGLTTGPHPMAYRRTEMNRLGIRRACDLSQIPNGQHVRIGGCVIARQRPGTARGFVFLSLEDETGIANAIITPDLLQKNRVLVISERFLLVEGTLQNLDNVISVKANRVLPLSVTRAETSSHDFH